MLANDIYKLTIEAEKQASEHRDAYVIKTKEMKIKAEKQARELLFSEAERFVNEKVIPEIVRYAKAGHWSHNFKLFKEPYGVNEYCHEIPINKQFERGVNFDERVCDFHVTKKHFCYFVHEILLAKNFESTLSVSDMSACFHSIDIKWRNIN